jgi:hypothetical protein
VPIDMNQAGPQRPGDGDAPLLPHEAADNGSQYLNGRASAPAAPRQPYVPTDVAKATVVGREADIVRAKGIVSNGRDHTRCPYPGHEDHNPSWRLMEDGRAVCSCRGPHSIFDVIMEIEGCDFESAKIRAMELIGRTDLIVDPSAPKAAAGLTLAVYAKNKVLPVDFLSGTCGMRDVPRFGKDRKPVVSIPYIAPDNTSSATRFRSAMTGQKRFIWRRGSQLCLYGAHFVAGMPKDRVVLVEGESDAQTLWHHGIPALGVPGATNWNEERDAPVVADFQTVYVIVEPDTGGEQMLSWLRRSSIAPRARLVRLPPEAKDPNALHCLDPDGFGAAFQRALDSAEPLPPEDIATAQATQAIAKLRRPEIMVVKGQLPFVVDAAEKALIDNDPSVFQFGDIVARVAPTAIAISDDRKTVGLRVVRIKKHHMIERMTAAANFKQFDKRSEEWESVDCPTYIAEAYLERVGVWSLPPLTAIMNMPTLRPDGSIIDQPGYDKATGILYDPRGVVFPPIPDRPLRDQALAALAELKALFAEFLFVKGDGSQSVALSAILTACIRSALPSAPLHAFNAPVAGSGKSKVVNTAAMIATGHEAPVISQAASEEETEKRIDAELIAGSTFISIDNIEHPLGGDRLCQATTEPKLRIRVLGLSENKEVPNRASFFATGNNLQILGDMTRRALLSTINPECERPELREFKTEDPVIVARRERPRLVLAVLTILRAFHVAGQPPKTTPLGSFEVWSRWVRDALVWLDEADPCLSMAQARASDPRVGQLSAVLQGWHNAIGAGEVTAKRAIEYAEQREHRSSTDLNPLSLQYPEFREALCAVAGDPRGGINSIRLGRYLGKSKGRIVDGFRIEPGALVRGDQRWQVKPVSEA